MPVARLPSRKRGPCQTQRARIEPARVWQVASELASLFLQSLTTPKRGARRPGRGGGAAGVHRPQRAEGVAAGAVHAPQQGRPQPRPGAGASRQQAARAATALFLLRPSLFSSCMPSRLQAPLSLRSMSQHGLRASKQSRFQDFKISSQDFKENQNPAVLSCRCRRWMRAARRRRTARGWCRRRRAVPWTLAAPRRLCRSAAPTAWPSCRAPSPATPPTCSTARPSARAMCCRHELSASIEDFGIDCCTVRALGAACLPRVCSRQGRSIPAWAALAAKLRHHDPG